MATAQLQKCGVLVVAAVLLATFELCNAKSVMVGGTNKWSLGTNYAAWAQKAGPFSVGDSLVFSYGAQKLGRSGVAHNVYLMKDLAHYQNCDFRGAVLLADPSKGAAGYKFTLNQNKPHYFACSIGNGFHCQSGMKFVVNPR